MTHLKRGGLVMSIDARTHERCDYELPGDFHTQVPGILAAMENGRVAPQAIVERCDQCCRFESDAAALARLVELGLADAAFAGIRKPFTVHCLAVMRVTFPGVLASDPKAAAQQSLQRFCWDTHGRSAVFADEFSGVIVEFDGDAGCRHTQQFDRQLNEIDKSNASGQ